MPDFFQTPRYQLPDEWEVSETMCVKVTIPADPQYYGQLIGLLDTLKWSKNFAPDATKTGAATVSRTWQAALESEPIEIEGCDMPEFRLNPDNCLLEVNCSDDPENPDWQPVPTIVTDPRELPYPPPYPDPPPEGQTNECISATNIGEWIWLLCGGWAGQLDGGTFAEFTVLVMSNLSALFQLLTSIVIDATTTLFVDIDPDTIVADFATLDKQDFIDLLVCYLDSDGSIPAASWGDFLSDLLALAGSNQAWYLVHYACLLTGFGGFNIAALIGGITEGDCASCEDLIATVTYDAGGYPYTMVHGTVAAGGNPDNCAHAENVLDGIWYRIASTRVDFTGEVTLKSCAADNFRESYAELGNIAVDVYVFDETDTIIHYTENRLGYDPDWESLTIVSGVNWVVPDGGYLRFDIALAVPSGSDTILNNTDLRMDNIVIVYRD